MPFGLGCLSKGARGPPRDNQDDPNRVLGVILGCICGPGGLPRGDGSLQETTQTTQNGPPAADGHVFPNMMKISLCKIVHVVVAISPFLRTEGAGRGLITTLGRKFTKNHNNAQLCNVHAVDAKRPFGGIRGSGQGLITTLG